MKKVNQHPLRKRKFVLMVGFLMVSVLAGCRNRSIEFLESELAKEEEMLQLTSTPREKTDGSSGGQDVDAAEKAGYNREGEIPQLTPDMEEAGSGMPPDMLQSGQQTEEKEPGVYVHVCGAVVNPGVYELDADSRVFQAVEMAGGVLPEAAVEYVNQAMVVSDGQQIYIPTEEEVSEGNLTGDFSVSSQSETEDKVNINTADETELMTISGIGESRAKDIIAYREAYGGFSAIEEIMNVPGIKEGTFEKIKDGIEVK